MKDCKKCMATQCYVQHCWDCFYDPSKSVNRELIEKLDREQNARILAQEAEEKRLLGDDYE